MNKLLSAGVALAVGLTVVLPGVAHAADKTILVPDDFVKALSDTRLAGQYQVVGTGLRIWTQANTSEDKVAEYVAAGVPLAGVGEPTLEYANTTGVLPGFQLVMDLDGDTVRDAILVGEPASYGNDWWTPDSRNTSSVVKGDDASKPSPGAPHKVNEGGFGSRFHGTLAEWRTNFPNAQVLAFGFSLGSGVKGDGVINALNFRGDRYTFGKRPADTTGPTVRCSVPEPGPIIAFGSASTVTATVTDEDSGPKAATVAGLADTSSVGTKSIELVGQDNAGNSTTTACSYTVVAGAPASVTLVSGSGQSAAVGTAFAQPVQVRVADSGNNPVSGATVTFSAPATGASGSFTTPSVITDSNGIASVGVTANSQTGNWTGGAAVAGVSAPATFSMTNTKAPAKRADLKVSVAGPSQLAKGKTGTYTVTVKNLGPDTATDVVASLLLPCSVVAITSTGGGVRAGTLVTWKSAKTLAVGASVTFSVTVKATNRGSGVVAAGAASLKTGDPVLNNNLAAIKISVR